MEQHYVHHVLRRPAGEWPDPANAASITSTRRSTCRCRAPASSDSSGKLLEWDRTADLDKIAVPTLVIGAEHDTMDPRHMEWMATAVQNGRSVILPHWQPHGHVRRLRHLPHRPHRLHLRRRFRQLSGVAASNPRFTPRTN